MKGNERDAEINVQGVLTELGRYATRVVDSEIPSEVTFFGDKNRANNIKKLCEAGNAQKVVDALHQFFGNYKERAKEYATRLEEAIAGKSAPVPSGNIIVEDSFRDLIPMMSADEYALLEKSILSEGCREAITVWAGENILLDGHNRHSICLKHKLPYQIVKKRFDSEEDAKKWMLRNQIGRRNLKPIDFTRLLGEMYELDKKDPSENLKQGDSPNGTNVRSGNTAESIAKEFKVNEKTVRKAGEFVTAENKIAQELDEDIKKKVNDKEVTQKQVVAAEKVMDENPELAKDILSGKAIAAVKAIKPETKQLPVETAGNATAGDYISLHVEVIKYIVLFFPRENDKGLGEVLKKYAPEQKMEILAMPRIGEHHD